MNNYDHNHNNRNPPHFEETAIMLLFIVSLFIAAFQLFSNGPHMP